jgi:multiple sugar transport system ATP-binding protein
VKLHRTLGVTTVYVTHDQTEAMTLGQRVAVLNKGVVQQVDEPQRLYHHPANTFVARFIGSPPMNFLRGRLDGDGVEIGADRLPLPKSLRRALRAREPDVLVGLRPEFFSDAARDAKPVLRAHVEVTEPLGPETLAYFRVDGLDVVELGDRPIELAGVMCARLNPRTRAVQGAPLELEVDTAGLRLFDPETGQSILAD